MKLSACILARNEARSVATLLSQLQQQTLFNRNDLTIDVHLVANGCTDNTAQRARDVAHLLDTTNARLIVHELREGGKSRSWNRAVHELIEPRGEMLLFLDSDISLIDGNVLDELFDTLTVASKAAACSGMPIKDLSAKKGKSLLDRLSLAVSERSQPIGAINGSLYLVRESAIRDIWLPDQTPGEDGFLNAMLTTHGFSKKPDPTRIISMARPTHFYQAHNPAQYLGHERRMIVGTMVNRWIFERLWSLDLKQPAGPTISDWNRSDPDWVESIIAENTSGKSWVIPHAILFGRLRPRAGETWLKAAVHLLSGTIATILTVPPAIAANRRLKERGAAGTW